MIQHKEFSYNKKYMKNYGELNSGQKHTGIYSEGPRALEFFINRPADLTFSQEKNNLHAKEVSALLWDKDFTTTAVSARLGLVHW